MDKENTPRHSGPADVKDVKNQNVTTTDAEIESEKSNLSKMGQSTIEKVEKEEQAGASGHSDLKKSDLGSTSKTDPAKK